jgi:hypothetical protein
MKVIPETYLMKVIPETYLMKCYSRNVSDEGYSRNVRDHCLNTLREQGHTYHEEEIKWSVTLPAIWSAEAKMFMRKACEQVSHDIIVVLLFTHFS